VIRSLGTLLHAGTADERQFVKDFAAEFGSENQGDASWWDAEHTWVDVVECYCRSRLGVTTRKAEEVAMRLLKGAVAGERDLDRREDDRG
jgi:hypothetical protein